MTIVVLEVFSAESRADEHCAVREQAPSHESASWSEAVHDVERTIAPAANDCRDIVVAADDHGAAVTFTTRDGRTAVRRISGPTELRPLIEALLVTVPQEPQGTTTSMPSPPELFQLPAHLATIDDPPRTPEALPSDPKRDERDRERLLVRLDGGTKVWPDNPASVVGEVAVGLVLNRWELGAVARWEPAGEGTQTSTGHVHLSAVGGRATLGRRELLGPVVVVFGSSTGAFAAEEEYRQAAPDSQLNRVRVHDAFVDPRLGAYVGIVAPTSSRFRLRAQIDGEIALSSHVAGSIYLPEFPRWSLGLTFGAEAAFLP